jgi:hypothetical protein
MFLRLLRGRGFFLSLTADPRGFCGLAKRAMCSIWAAMGLIRPTIGLTSRDGIIPLNFFADVGGPMARSVADAATVLSCGGV